jgi:hypothetical protein
VLQKKQPMKTKSLFANLTVLSSLFFACASHAVDITATNSGNWSDTNIWNSGTAPGPNDDADIPAGINVTVNTNVIVQYIYDSGTVTMGINSSLNLLQDQAIATSITLNTTAPGNTVIYSGNPFFALETNYCNLVLANTNFVDPIPPYQPYQFFNNFSQYGPTPMTIAGNMTLMGAVEVQQGTDGPGASSDIHIGGNLIIGAGCAWDSSGANLTVVSNTYVYGLLEDLNGALGSNYFGGNIIVAGPSTSVMNYNGGTYTNGWYVSDVTTWFVSGGLTNNGSIFGLGYGSISFNGTGTLAGSPITLPTMVVNGSYAIGTTITLTTNTPGLFGILTFDIANTNKIVFTTGSTNLTLYYGGNLNVVNSGPTPVSGNIYKLFSAAAYTNSFVTSFPSLPGGLSWVNSLRTNGTIVVTGSGSGSSPIISLSRSGQTLTLSWNSATFPGYRVQAQTNRAGIGTNWGNTSSGTVSPYMVTITPTNPPVFYRLINP